DLLPVNYLHMVFTIPDKLNPLFLYHQTDCYNILFRIVNQVMIDFAANPKFLDARIGYTAILHTWGQNLQYHPHLHLVVPAGGITRNNKWKPSKGDGSFLFPVDKLSSVFRAKMVETLRDYVQTEQIKTDPGMFNSLFEKEWVVYIKPPFAGPKQVLSYLGRYTHRVAISNNRILKVDDNQVTFLWRDYHQNYRQIITTINGTEFLKRFCLHILPLGFTRIRHYGYLSSAAKTKALALLREYFYLPPGSEYIRSTWQAIVQDRMGIEAQCCKKCGHLMQIIRIMPDRFHRPIRAPSCSA
ncbi:MAG: transposase, partial [Desulfobacterales bacterium]